MPTDNQFPKPPDWQGIGPLDPGVNANQRRRRRAGSFSRSFSKSFSGGAATVLVRVGPDNAFGPEFGPEFD